MRKTSAPAMGLILSVVAATPAGAAPADNLRELFAGLGVCMKDVAGEPGEELTIAFSLKRDGSLFGKPHIAASKLPNDPAAKALFLDSVAASFAKCLPAPITDALGGAIAGRRLTVRFVIPRRDIGT